MAAAEASVAWPHRGTSVVGVNQRRENLGNIIVHNLGRYMGNNSPLFTLIQS